ncbi:MAG: hypothetical protein GY824_02730, partial [Delftia sp.]|nr:hypothetical protein [Delftia sp.]
MFDTMIAEWLINPASKNLGLKNLAWARLQQRMTPIVDLIGKNTKGKPQRTMAQVPVGLMVKYVGRPAIVGMMVVGLSSFTVLGLVVAVVPGASLAAWGYGVVLLYVLRRLVHKSRRAGRRQTSVLRSLSARLTDCLQSVKPL